MRKDQFSALPLAIDLVQQQFLTGAATFLLPATSHKLLSRSHWRWLRFPHQCGFIPRCRDIALFLASRNNSINPACGEIDRCHQDWNSLYAILSTAYCRSGSSRSICRRCQCRSRVAPLIYARNELGAGATGYGVLLGFFGAGGVIGGLLMPQVRRHLSRDQTLSGLAVIYAAATAVLGQSMSHGRPMPRCA
jgi:hypothetical protein